MKPSLNHTSLRVWDLPTRLFHWALAACVIALIITGLRGGGAMEWHMRLGYCVATLLMFRIVWGFVGGYWSRFVQFFYSPITIINYLRGKSLPAHDVGHNPLGSLSVWALLIILIAQVSTGLVSDDEIATQGIMAKFVSSATSLLATGYHKHWGKWIIMALVALHVAAILFYVFKKKENLIRPMVLGDKAADALAGSALPASKDGNAQRLTALGIFIVIVIGVSYAVKRFG
jgi:cytochrome b